MTDLDKLKAVFINEAREIVEDLDSMLVNLEHTPDDRELLNAVFRQLHTLKGSGGIVEFRALEVLAHAQEDLLDYLRTQDISPTQEMLDLFFDGLDTIKALIDTFAKGGEPSISRTNDLVEGFRAFLPEDVPISEGKGTKREEDPDREILEVSFFSTLPEEVKENAGQHLNKGGRLYRISINLECDALKAGLDPIPPLKGLTHLGDILHASSDPLIPSLQEIDPTFLYINRILILFASKAGVKEIEEVFEFLMEAGDIDIHPLTPLDLKEYIGIEIDKFWSESKPGKVGEILVKSGMVEEEDVDRALSIQERSIGRILVDEKLAMPEDVEKALKIQQKVSLAPSQFIRIDTEKVDILVNLVGELVIADTIVSQSRAVRDIEDPTFRKNSNQLTKIIKEIQGQAMSLRMVPLRQTFQKMARIVRDVARKNGKEVDLLLRGEDTELDKRLIDRIGDPLMHLLRNAVDHGIEPPEERDRKNKSRKGVVSLNAFHQSGNIVIEVGDDGKGIDREKIIEKAVERGLIENNDSMAALTDEEIYRFMFHPGFSTADRITDVSGRGVGLDIVKRGVEDLRGRVDITSRLNKGSAFTIKLPLTLAIIDGMVIGVGEERYVIPTLQIAETIQPAKESVFTVQGGGEMIKIRDVLYPLVRLHKLFGIKPRVENPWEALVMVVESEGERCCLLVDDLAGHQQVVIKTLGDGFKRLKGVSGGAILSDGRVGLILDMGGIREMVMQ